MKRVCLVIFMTLVLFLAGCSGMMDEEWNSDASNGVTNSIASSEESLDSETEESTVETSDNESISEEDIFEEDSSEETDQEEGENEDVSSQSSVSSTPVVSSQPVTSSQPTVSSQPAHVHSFSAATCTAPKQCSCGETQGDALGHNWTAATCTAAKKCSSCGLTDGNALGHQYSGGSCMRCGAEDPNYVRDVMVWIPTNGGKKYHSRSGCSNMIDPAQVTKSEAIAQGFGACGKCY